MRDFFTDATDLLHILNGALRPLKREIFEISLTGTSELEVSRSVTVPRRKFERL